MEVKELEIKEVKFYDETKNNFDGSPLYRFNVTDSEGNRYSYQGKSKDKPKVTEGKGTYEVHEKEGKNGKFYVLKPHNEKPFKKGGGYKKSPEEIDSMNMQTAQECALDFMHFMNSTDKSIDAFNAIVDSFFEYLKSCGDVMYRPGNSLKRAVQTLNHPEMGIEVSRESVIKYAKAYFNKTNFKK